MSLGNNSTPPQSVEMVDPEGSCKKDNSKAECNCFGPLSENEIIFFDLKCQCKNNDSKMDPEGSCKKDNSEPVYRLYWRCLDLNGDWTWQPVPEHHRLSELNLDSCKIMTEREASQ